MIHITKETDTPKDTIFLSVSRIKLWQTCKVCYAARYLDKIEQAPNAAAQRGVDIHKMLEDYLSLGKPIDPSSKYGKMALAGIKHLPNPGACEVEDKFAFSYEGIFFRGIIDFYYKKDNLWVVGDHKTTKNFQYALTKYALPKDLQASLYAFYIMNKMNVDSAELNWVYYLTQGSPTSRLVSGTLDLTTATESVNLVLDDCREMLDAHKKGLTALDFRPPVQGCRGFGPCAASLFGNQLMRDPRMSEKRSLKEMLDKRAGENPAPETVIEEALEVLEEALPETKQKSIVEKVRKETKEDGEWFLFIDCLPRQGFKNVIEFSELLKPVFRAIASEYNVSHPSFIPYESLGVFVTRLDKYLSDNPVAPGTVVLMSSGSWASANAIDVLTAHGSRIIQGC